MTAWGRIVVGTSAVAAAWWLAATAWQPFDARQVVQRAEARIARAELERAVTILEEGRARIPGHPDLAAAVGRVQVMRARWREGDEALAATASAIAAYTRAIEASPLDADRYADLGWAQVRLGQPNEAVPAFEAAVERDPANVYILASLARAFEDAGRVDDAIRSYRRAQAILPTKIVAERLEALEQAP